MGLLGLVVTVSAVKPASADGVMPGCWRAIKGRAGVALIAEEDEGGVRLLLGLLGDRIGPVYGRLGLADGKDAPRQQDPWYVSQRLDQIHVPASVLLWMLETGDPDIRTCAYRASRMPEGLRREIVAGRPLRPKRRPRPDVDLLAELYAVRTMADGRALANGLAGHEWSLIATADSEKPLPGYARWNLAIRIDCPAGLRAQFGDHPKFRHRLRQAGIVSGPREYLEGWRPARQVLGVLALGAWAFPARLEEARDVLRPFVQDLGPDPEPWAVLAQLLPTFSGTVPELLATTRAISGV